MKYTILLIAFSLAAIMLGSCSQQMKIVKTNKTDSIAVNAVWKQYVKALSAKNVRALQKLSLKQVYCQPCAVQSNASTELVTAANFINSMLSNLPQTKLWAAVKTTKPIILTEQIKNYKPQNLNLPGNATVIVYDIWYAIPGTDKIKGFEGRRFAFQFVKNGGQYKLFGLTAVQ